MASASRRAGRAAVCLFMGAVLAAAPAAAIELRSGERVEARGTANDMSLLAGRQVVVELASPDDIFAAGRDLTVRRTRADHVFLAGAEVVVSGLDAKDAVVAAARARLDGGQTRDDLTLAAGRVVLGREFKVGGSALINGGEVEIEGAVVGELRAAGGDVRIDGPIGGDVELSGDDVVIGPNARIGGDLVYSAARADISPSAVIEGTQRRVPRSDSPRAERVAGVMAAAAVAFALVFVLGMVLLVLAAVAAFPSLMDRSAERIARRPWPTAGVGLALMVLGPLAILLLLVSIIGIPLGLLVGALYLAAAPMALAAVTYYLGQRARTALAHGHPPERTFWTRVGWTLTTVVLLFAVGAIPFVGQLVWFVASIFGLGAVVIEVRHALSGSREPGAASVS